MEDDDPASEGSAAREDGRRLVERFEEERPRLLRLAYGMLGNQFDADEAVQETWIRLGSSDASSVDNLGGWLTTVTGRIALDMIRSRGRRAIAVDDADGASDQLETATAFEHEVIMADAVSRALLVVLDTLSPAERLAFVLHDLFAVPFEEIARILERSPAASKMLASRARHKVQGGSIDERHSNPEHAIVVEAFLAAARAGDIAGLVSVLHPDASMFSDRQANAMGSPGTVEGAENVAAVFSGRALGAERAWIDEVAGLVWIVAGQPKVAWEFTIHDGQITRIDMVADGDTLADARIESSP